MIGLQLMVRSWSRPSRIPVITGSCLVVDQDMAWAHHPDDAWLFDFRDGIPRQLSTIGHLSEPPEASGARLSVAIALRQAPNENATRLQGAQG
jgi:hypothetical protein